MADTNFNVKYPPGKLSVDCDYLSRHSVDEIRSRMEKCTEEMNDEMINAVATESKQKGKFAMINSYSCHVLEVAPEVGNLVLSQINPVEVVQAQKNDPVIGELYRLVTEGRCPSHKMKKKMVANVKTLLKQWNQLKLNEDNILVCKVA